MQFLKLLCPDSVLYENSPVTRSTQYRIFKKISINRQIILPISARTKGVAKGGEQGARASD